MKTAMCECEELVVRAVRSGHWTDALRTHAASCESCAEAMLVAGLMMEDAAHDEPAVPDAGLVWWKAELRFKRERAERALRPILFAERVATVALAAAIAAGTALLWPESPSLAMATLGGLAVLAVFGGSAIFFAISRK